MSTHPLIRGRSSELRKGRISEEFACYAISKGVHQRRSALAADASSRILLISWQYLRSHERIKLFAFCIMPDHYHLVFCLMPSENLSKVMEDSGKFTARELNKLLGKSGQFWQEGFHDRRCRDDKELYDLSSYIEHHPVRAGIVAAAELWPYSSAFPANKAMLDRE